MENMITVDEYSVNNTMGKVFVENGGFAGPIGDPVPDYGETGKYEGDIGMPELSAEVEVSAGDKLMSSWLFIGGISAGVLVLGVFLGILAGKHRIKKGFDLYED